MEETKTPMEQLLDMWSVDAKIDETEPGKELAKIPVLHAKYLKILMKHSGQVKSYEFKLAKERNKKTNYYSGRMDQDELAKFGLQPYKLVLKNEVEDYVEADEEVIKLKMVWSAHKEMVDATDRILKELNSRTYQLRGLIDWERYIMGQ